MQNRLRQITEVQTEVQVMKNTMSIDGEKIDVQSNCEFDKWYTTTVKLSNQTSQIDFAFWKMELNSNFKN